MQLHERTIPTEPHAHETGLLRGLGVQGPHVQAQPRPRGRGELMPRLNRVGGRVQHRQVATLIDRDLAQLTVVEAPRERSPCIRAPPEARGRHEAILIALPARLRAPFLPARPKLGVAPPHTLLALDCALSGGTRARLRLARRAYSLDDPRDDVESDDGDKQRDIGMPCDHSQ